jgi:hypothetical protein
MTSLPATKDDSAWQDYANRTAPSRIVGSLLKFHQSFDWITGIDNEAVPLGTKLIAVMPVLQVGFTKWEDNRPVAYELGAPAEGYRLPDREDLGDDDETAWPTDNRGEKRDPWQETALLPLVDAASKEVFTYSTGSWGGRAAIGGLMKEYAAHARQKPNDLPIVELGSGSKKSQDPTIGRYKIPTLKIVGWTDAGPAMLLLDKPVEASDGVELDKTF